MAVIISAIILVLLHVGATDSKGAVAVVEWMMVSTALGIAIVPGLVLLLIAKTTQVRRYIWSIILAGGLFGLLGVLLRYSDR